MPTIRNARRANIYVVNGDKTVFFRVQPKARTRRFAVPLGRDGEAFLLLDHPCQRRHKQPHLFSSYKATKKNERHDTYHRRFFAAR